MNVVDLFAGGSMTPVSLTLRDARAIANYFATTGPAGEIDPALRSLARAIARANRALVPGRWNIGDEYHYRLWPVGVGSGSRQACLVDAGSYAPGWKVRDHRDHEIASGPETGAEGRRLADAALAKWAKRQGWRP